ncbi:MAG: hypothetical protein EOP88_06380 [Verrucomicrobiaceae bacterium]|nr:MAG: hypothetical protein EOP88_06380 [Verrucomicrobiaceae bacterium]
MSFLDRLERRWGWIAFPGLLRYYALMHVMVLVVQYLRPGVGEMLAFDRGKILSGEVWRLATMFFASPGFGNTSPLFLLLLVYCAVTVMFMVSDGLESAWGSFKTTLFLLTGIVSIVAMNFVYPSAVPLSGSLLYASAFLAFATLFPREQLLVFFFLPVQIRFLGMLVGAGVLLMLLGSPLLAPFFLVVFANYFLWAGIPALRGTALVIESGQRRKRFNAAKMPASEAFHTCKVCGKTDTSDPHAEFRIGKDGEEYCSEHLGGD